MKKAKSLKQTGIPTSSERRQIENEVVFRKANEKVQKGLSELEKIAKAEGNEAMLPDPNLPIYFYCECSDENCHERIALTRDKYKQLHKDRKRFIVIPDHEVEALEEIVAEKNKYNIVKKFIRPPETASTLNATSLNNV